MMTRCHRELLSETHTAKETITMCVSLREMGWLNFNHVGVVNNGFTVRIQMKEVDMSLGCTW